MKTVGIWEPNGVLSDLVQRSLQSPWREKYHFISTAQPDALCGVPLEVLAIAPQAEMQTVPHGIKCRMVLLPGVIGSLVRKIQADSVVSYGSSSKDTLTISSIETGPLSIAIQRELVTVQSGTVERQELVLPSIQSVSPSLVLACAGLLLMLGVSTEELNILPSYQ